MVALLRSLRCRIAMAFVLWTALMQVIITTALPPAREVFSLRSVDAKLLPPAEDLAREIREAQAFPPDLTALTLDPLYTGWGEQLYLMLRDDRGNVVATSANLEGRAFPFVPDDIARANGTPVFATVRASEMPEARGGPELNGPARARVVTVPLQRADAEQVYFLQIARSLVGMDRIRDIFQAILILISAISILGAGAAGWIVAGRICAHLDRISTSVRRISPTNLDERLDRRSLPDEIGRLATDVNIMLERLAQGFHSQERFISDVSHELKTPVAVLLTEAQTLKMGQRTEADFEAFALSVEDEMRRLGKLVESFLLLARFGHGRRFLGELVFPINDVALESVQHAKRLAAQHGVAIALSFSDPDVDGDDGNVLGDPDLVRIAIDNLVRNAIQYSKRGDTVSVSVSCKSGQALIAVKDQGRGVPEQYLKTIFDRFAQAPGTSSSGRRGTGLGLAIAKGVVDLHGGTIDVRNLPEGGCAFTVTLPLHREAPSSLEPHTVSHPMPSDHPLAVPAGGQSNQSLRPAHS